jgi:hypothetical protein
LADDVENLLEVVCYTAINIFKKIKNDFP